ncbi:MAG: hypothetical protein AAGG11_04760 [Pseudomonadota bacterium]
MPNHRTFLSQASLRAVYLLLSVSLLLSGCTLLFDLNHDRAVRHDVTQTPLHYLYPDGRPAELATKPATQLNLPLSVGLAYVPGDRRAALPQGISQRLLTALADQFQQQAYIASITVLPPESLRPSGGFADLELAAHLHGVDVVVLVSYDQVAYLDNTAWSLFDLTLVGSYLTQAHRGDTHTAMALIAVHVPTRRTLLTATGHDQQQRRTSLAHASGTLREQQAVSLNQAAVALATDLHRALTDFHDQLDGQDDIQVTGAGAADPGSLLLLAGGVLWLKRRSRRAQPDPARDGAVR